MKRQKSLVRPPHLLQPDGEMVEVVDDEGETDSEGEEDAEDDEEDDEEDDDEEEEDEEVEEAEPNANNAGERKVSWEPGVGEDRKGSGERKASGGEPEAFWLTEAQVQRRTSLMKAINVLPTDSTKKVGASLEMIHQIPSGTQVQEEDNEEDEEDGDEDEETEEDEDEDEEDIADEEVAKEMEDLMREADLKMTLGLNGSSNNLTNESFFV